MVSEEGLKVWPSRARGLIKQKVTHCQYAFIPLLLGQGTPAFSCLGFPMQGKAKQKKKHKKGNQKKSALNSIPTFRSPPFSFLLHTQDHTLALAPPGTHLPANTAEVTISLQFWLSFKEKCPKRNPKSSVVQPHPLPWSMTTLAAHRLWREGLSSCWESGQWVL